MHELGIAAEAYRMCRARLDARPDGPFRLERVALAVGELSAVEPDLLRFAWEAVVEDTPDRGAVLEVEWRPARQSCAACGEVKDRQPGSWLRLCPACGGALSVEGGQELDVLRFTCARRAAEAAPSAGGAAR
uniref:Hydrogenase maturation nickel metallochaperone HypA n=1 Tax=Eiseniibacteriota bacterium TaxID=2212470 RepID=A0A832I2G4_UNCEI